MKETTLCYIKKNNEYLFMLRNKKTNDPNGGKYIGVGGKLEKDETPLQCVIREIKEETNLKVISPTLRGEIYFYSDIYAGSRIHRIKGEGYE